MYTGCKLLLFAVIFILSFAMGISAEFACAVSVHWWRLPFFEYIFSSMNLSIVEIVRAPNLLAVPWLKRPSRLKSIVGLGVYRRSKEHQLHVTPCPSCCCRCTQVFKPRTPLEAISLCSRLLEYTPATRLSPLEACANSFFDELREPNTRLPNGRDLPPLFNFSPVGKWLEAAQAAPGRTSALLP